MKFARREGAQLILLTLGHGIRDGMREHADLVIDRFPFPGGENLGTCPESDSRRVRSAADISHAAMIR